MPLHTWHTNDILLALQKPGVLAEAASPRSDGLGPVRGFVEEVNATLDLGRDCLGVVLVVQNGHIDKVMWVTWRQWRYR